MITKCISCHKPHPYGKDLPDDIWICMQCREYARVPIQCECCGTTFGVKWDTYRMKDHSLTWRCRRCNDDYRNQLYEDKSPEEKKAFVESQTARVKAYYANRTPEEIEKDHERRKNVWVKLREENRAEGILATMKEGRKQWYDSLSDEEKEARLDILYTAQREWLDNLTEEDKKLIGAGISERSKEMWANRSPEEKERIMSAALTGVKKFWDTIDSEKFDKWCRNLRDGMKRHYDSLGYIDNKNELNFSNILMRNGLDYEWQYPSQMKHPDFEILFPVDPENCWNWDWYHLWDFCVHTRSGNILIDIDGSHHSIAGEEFRGEVFTVAEHHEIKDSQRFLQTDGMEAFVVECPNDEFDDTAIVYSIRDKRFMDFRDFLLYLNWMNLDKKSKKYAIEGKF